MFCSSACSAGVHALHADLALCCRVLVQPVPSPYMTRPLASLTQRARAAVSGTVPEEPVINKQSGLLFEKRLIEKHVQVSA
jgi:hypothetical protein